MEQLEWVNTETGEILDRWPTSDEVLADWMGCEPADLAEGFTIINWEGIT